MSELRQDPISGRWVILAEERSARPMQFNTDQPTEREHECHFCVDHESSTPPETFAIRTANSRPNESGWSCRVVPNKYPAVDSNPQVSDRNAGAKSELFRSMPAAGGHEVVIEAAQHVTRGANLDIEHWRDILRTYRERLLYWKREGYAKAETKCPFAVIFKNVGRDGGASLEHIHSQLLVLRLRRPRLSRS